MKIVKIYFTILSAFFVLLSCESTTKFYASPINSEFNSKTNRSVVVFGFWSQNRNISKKVQRMTIQWVKFDPRSFLISDGGFSVVRSSCASKEDVTNRERCNHNVADWYVAVIDPGYYALHYISLEISKGYRTSKSLIKTYSQNNGAGLSGYKIENPKNIFFNVKKNEIVYIGDFLLNISPKKGIYYDYSVNKSSATSALREYRNIVGELEYLKPSSLKEKIGRGAGRSPTGKEGILFGSG